jgi:hypothetical protein
MGSFATSPLRPLTSSVWRFKMRLTATLSLLVGLAGCAGLSERDSAMPAWVEKLSSGAHTLGAMTQQECQAADGDWSGAQGAEIAVCSRRVRDAGATCNDHLDCDAFCITRSQVSYGSRTEGVCASSFDSLGCIQGVSHGRAEPTFCACP